MSENNMAEMHNALAWNKIGTDATDAGNYNFAIEAFTKSIELNPEAAYTYYRSGELYFKLKKYNKAIKDFNKSIKLNPMMYMHIF